MFVIAALLASAAPAAGTAMPVQAANSAWAEQALAAIGKLEDEGKWQQALDACQAIENRTDLGAWRPVLQLRKSRALLVLGRTEEARPILIAVLSAVAEDDAMSRTDRAQGWLNLGALDEAALDYANAYGEFGRALALSDKPAARAAALRGRIATGMIIDQEGAKADVTQAEALIEDSALGKREIATLEIAVSQFYINAARYKEALAVAQSAVVHLGGFGGPTDLLDAAARGNVALAALKLGRIADARQYIAASGAGRSENAFALATQMRAPPCGGEAGLRPDDMAVVEFTVSPAGEVTRANPIYSTRPGAVALAFAAAARQWSWAPESIKDLPAFYRTRARIELRCSSEFARPALGDFVRSGLTRWLEQNGAKLPANDDASDAAQLASQRAAVAAQEHKADSSPAAMLAALHVLMTNSVLSKEERGQLARRELAIAIAAHAPALARLEIERHSWMSNNPFAANTAVLADLRAALQAPHYAADPLARAAIRLMIADTYRPDQAALAEAELRTVADDAAVPDSHPFKTGALMRIASIEAAAGRIEAARAVFDRTGLASQQCALLDAPPKPTNPKLNSEFPFEALQWRFEGWVTVQYDIDATGTPRGARPVIAYPPFVFTEFAPRLVNELRYAPSFRPGGEPGCGGINLRINYRMAD